MPMLFTVRRWIAYRLEKYQRITFSAKFRARFICGIGVSLLFYHVTVNANLADVAHSPIKTRVSGSLKNETAYRFDEPRTYTKIKNILSLKSESSFFNWFDLKLSTRIYHDLAYDLFDYQTISARSEREVDQPLAFVENLPQEKDSPGVDLREAYVTTSFGKLDLSLGKQIIVWGILPGIRVVDEINPMDFREFITPELMDYRIPLWSAKADLYTPLFNLELIAIPDMTFHKPAPRGSEWELFQEVPGTTYPKRFRLRNTEFGARISSELAGFDISLSYFNTWDDFPVLYRKVVVVQVRGSIEPEFHPRYERMSIIGGTAQKELFGQIFKLEAALVRGKYFGMSLTDPNGNPLIDTNGDGLLDNDGVFKKNHIRIGAGIDFNIFKTEVSPSVTEWVILKHEPALIQKKYDTTVNLFLRKTFPERNAFFELLGISILNFNELYLRPKFGFSPSTRFQITTGMDLFWGNKSRLGMIALNGRPTELATVTQSVHFIGNFNANNRAFFEMKYSF